VAKSALAKFIASADLVLTDAGYKRIDPRKPRDDYPGLDVFIYKALWSTSEVEHFIYFSQNPKQKTVVMGQFGIRNPEVEAFGITAIRKYGDSAVSSGQLEVNFASDQIDDRDEIAQ
jgi:hypothetical protein